MKKLKVIKVVSSRPETIKETIVKTVGLEKSRIIQGIEILETQISETMPQVTDFLMNNVSKRFLKIVLSYTDCVNRNVWRKI